MRVLDLEKVRSPREHERLGVREPFEHALVDLAVGGQADSGVGVRAYDREDRLLDARGVMLRELPLRDRREFAREKRVRVGGGLFHSTRQLEFDGATIVLAAHFPQERVNGAGLVAGFIYRDRRAERLDEGATARNVEQGRFKQCKRADRIWRVEGELNADDSAG